MKRILSVAALGVFMVSVTAFVYFGSGTSKMPSAPVAVSESVTSEPATSEPADYGRMIFVGDSRSVDLFSEPADAVEGEVHDGITVYARDGLRFDYLVDSVNTHGLDNFDTLVSWMGCNDFGDFSRYDVYYDKLLAQGKNLVLCTVGPTVDECLLHDIDYMYYPNANQITYNNSLKSWAAVRGIKVIDMYEYIKNSDTIIVDPTDGIHYFPVPNTEMWEYIVGNLK